MIDAYIGVGSNIDPEQNLPKALELLQHQVEVLAVSTVYRTAPVGRPEQPDYFNAVWRIGTTHSARVIKFKVLREIESLLGRIRTEDKYRARTIDLDLLLYGGAVIHEADLVLPDPDIRKRLFLAFPLVELNPTLILPDTQERLQAVISNMSQAELQPVSEITNFLKRMVHDE